MKQQNYKRGFTLIELILFMGLFSIILLVLTSIFAELMQKQLEIQSMSSVESDKSYILSRLEYDIGRADTIIAPASAGDSTETLVLEIDGNTVTYNLNGTDFELDNAGDIQKLNNVRTAISNVTFQRIGNSGGTPTIDLHMNITSIVSEASGPRDTEINTTLGGR